MIFGCREYANSGDRIVKFFQIDGITFELLLSFYIFIEINKEKWRKKTVSFSVKSEDYVNYLDLQ